MNEEIRLQLKKSKELKAGIKAEKRRLKKEIFKKSIGIIKIKYDRFWVFTLLGLGRIIGDWPKWLNNWHYMHYLKIAKQYYKMDPKQAVKDILDYNDEETIKRLFKDLGINQ